MLLSNMFILHQPLTQKFMNRLGHVKCVKLNMNFSTVIFRLFSTWN